MLYVLYSYVIAIGYSIIAREVYNVSAHDPWNWVPCAGVISLGIGMGWFEWWAEKGGEDPNGAGP